MRDDTLEERDGGFGLVELVIAMFILMLIATAMIPVLFNGIAQSSRQGETATATRFLYSVVEQGREAADDAGGVSNWCAGITNNVTNTPGNFSVVVDECAADAQSLVTITLTAKTQGVASTQLATISAKVYVP